MSELRCCASSTAAAATPSIWSCASANNNFRRREKNREGEGEGVKVSIAARRTESAIQKHKKTKKSAPPTREAGSSERGTIVPRGVGKRGSLRIHFVHIHGDTGYIQILYTKYCSQVSYCSRGSFSSNGHNFINYHQYTRGFWSPRYDHSDKKKASCIIGTLFGDQIVRFETLFRDHCDWRRYSGTTAWELRD